MADLNNLENRLTTESGTAITRNVISLNRPNSKSAINRADNSIIPIAKSGQLLIYNITKTYYWG